MKKPISALLFFTLIFTSLYSFTACEETGDNNALKIEYSIEAVNQAILEATSNHHPSDIKKDQYVKYEDNYQIELTDPRVSGFIENKVLEVLEDDTQYLITLQETSTAVDADGNQSQKVSEQKVKLLKDLELTEGLKAFKGVAAGGLINNSFSLKNDSELKIFNLEIESTSVPYPNSIQKKMGCHKDSPCHFDGTRIKFLVHEYVNKTDPIEFSVDRIYMTDGSFLHGTFSSCISRFFEAPERDYYIKQCSVLRDYE